jgi:hypothetical protein
VEKICSPENCFSAWRQIFDPVPSKESVELDPDSDPVDIFSDWMPNLFDDDDDFHPGTNAIKLFLVVIDAPAK